MKRHPPNITLKIMNGQSIKLIFNTSSDESCNMCKLRFKCLTNNDEIIEVDEKDIGVDILHYINKHIDLRKNKEKF